MSATGVNSSCGLPAGLQTELERIVGPGHVINDPDLRRGYEADATGRFRGNAAAVVRPADTREVAAVMRACAGAGLPVVPQGGNTGLVGGGVPRGGEIVLSLTRLNDLERIDDVESQVVVGAGATLAAVQQHTEGRPLQFGVDFGARDSATLGGMLATNAGGPHVLRHGSMADQVTGVEAVLADGTIIDRLRGVQKDTAGYAFDALLAGSEGTLAIVTALRVRLVKRPSERIAAIVGLSDMTHAVQLASSVPRQLACLQAVDFFHQDGLDLVCAHRRLQPPFKRRFGTYLLLECAGEGDLVGALANAVAACADDIVVADDTRGRGELWTFREAHNESIRAAGIPHKFDVALPLAAVADFEVQVAARMKRVDPNASIVIYGHLADGNLHVNVLGPEPADERVDECVLGLAAELGGSISAEHGVGQAKARWIHLSRSRAEVELMRAVKAAFDPAGLLNPGKIFHSQTDQLCYSSPMVQKRVLHQVSTVDALTADLAARILDGKLRPGTRLPEEQLSAEYSVGRHTLREALERLGQQGLIQREYQKGARVRSMTAGEIRDFYLFRTMIEQGTVRLLAASATAPPGAVEALRAFESLADDAPWSQVVEADLDVHWQFVAGTNSSRLMRAYEALVPEIKLCIAQLRPAYDSPHQIAAEHRAIVAAIAAGDADAAAEAVAAHLVQYADLDLSLDGEPEPIRSSLQGQAR